MNVYCFRRKYENGSFIGTEAKTGRVRSLGRNLARLVAMATFRLTLRMNEHTSAHAVIGVRS